MEVICWITHYWCKIFLEYYVCGFASPLLSFTLLWFSRRKIQQSTPHIYWYDTEQICLSRDVGLLHHEFYDFNKYTWPRSIHVFAELLILSFQLYRLFVAWVVCVAFVAWVAVVALVALVIWFSNSEQMLWLCSILDSMKSYNKLPSGADGAWLRKELLTKRIIQSEIYTTSVFECHKCV